MRWIFSLSAALAISAGSAAFSQNLGEFDCAAFVRDNHIGDPSLQLQQRMPGNPPRRLLLPTPAAANDSTEPALNENLGSGGAPLWMTGYFDVAGSRIGCVLFQTTFQYGADALPIVLERGRINSDQQTAVPFLLMRRFSNPAQANAELERWSNSPNFSIYFGASGGITKTWELLLSAFGNTNFMPSFARFSGPWDAGIVVSMRSVGPDTAGVFTHMGDNIDSEPDLLAFCNDEPCSAMYQAALSAEDASFEPSRTVLELAPSTREITLPRLAPVGTPPPLLAEPFQELPNFVQSDVSMQFILESGELSESGTNALRDIGPLECLLSQIAPDAFASAPNVANCDAGIIANILTQHAAIHVTGPGEWQIVQNGAVRAPETIIVTLPAGQDSSLCRISVEYEINAYTRPFELPLQPNDGTFGGAFYDGIVPLIQDGNVTLTIKPNDAAACGGAARQVVIPTATELEVSLAESASGNRAIAHLVVPMAGRRASELGLGAEWELAFGETMINAVGAAHVRASQTLGDRPWALRSMHFSALTASGRVAPILNLESNFLRSNPTQGFREPGTVNQARSLGSGSVVFDATSMLHVLEELRQDAVGQSIDSLDVTLIAPILESGTIVAVDACAETWVSELARSGLLNEDGPHLNVSIFPVIGLGEGDRIDGSDLVPVSGQSGLGLGGLYHCANTPAGINIYPFFVEYWRGPMDILPRYFTALSDQLSLIIANLVD